MPGMSNPFPPPPIIIAITASTLPRRSASFARSPSIAGCPYNPSSLSISDERALEVPHFALQLLTPLRLSAPRRPLPAASQPPGGGLVPSSRPRVRVLSPLDLSRLNLSTRHIRSTGKPVPFPNPSKPRATTTGQVTIHTYRKAPPLSKRTVSSRLPPKPSTLPPLFIIQRHDLALPPPPVLLFIPRRQSRQPPPPPESPPRRPAMQST
jgi:hypothetical protein